MVVLVGSAAAQHPAPYHNSQVRDSHIDEHLRECVLQTCRVPNLRSACVPGKGVLGPE